jgi:hypothetical protein
MSRQKGQDKKKSNHNNNILHHNYNKAKYKGYTQKNGEVYMYIYI